MVMRGFKKCGISVSVDGSEDDQINIKDLEGYPVDDSDESDPFASSDSSSSASDSDDSQCDDDEIILSSEDDDETLLQMSTAPFNSITDEEKFRLFLWMNYPVDLQAISQTILL